MDDPELAKSSFESVLRSRPDHRGALEALVRLYRREDAVQPLCAILGKLQELAETQEDAFRIGWERAEILSEELDSPQEAADILEKLSDGLAGGSREVATTLLDLYERSEQWRSLIKQAEVVLLATESTDERRRLYELISNTWRDRLEDKRAALSAYARYVTEFNQDLAALWNLAELQLEVDEVEAAIVSLERRLTLADDLGLRTSTLEQMSEIGEERLQNPPRALEYLRRALTLDPRNDMLVDKIREMAERHQLWAELLRISEQRFAYAQSEQDPELQVAIAEEATELAEHKQQDARAAFDWSQRGYFVAIAADRPADTILSTLERLAQEQSLWTEMLGVIEREIEFFESRGIVEDGSFDAVSRLVTASEIAEEHLGDPERAVGFLQRAHRLRPADEQLADRLEQTAERYNLWQAVIELHGGRLGARRHGLGSLRCVLGHRPDLRGTARRSRKVVRVAADGGRRSRTVRPRAFPRSVLADARADRASQPLAAAVRVSLATGDRGRA